MGECLIRNAPIRRVYYFSLTELETQLDFVATRPAPDAQCYYDAKSAAPQAPETTLDRP